MRHNISTSSSLFRPAKSFETHGECGGFRHEIKIFHGFRKYFITTANLAGMHLDYVRMLAGQSLPCVQSSYFKPTLNNLLEGTDSLKGYKDIIDSVTINEENKLK